MGKLLVQLQVRKSTADGKGAKEFYTDLTKPPPEWEGEIRDLVLKKKLVGILVATMFSSTEGFPPGTKDLHSTQYLYRE